MEQWQLALAVLGLVSIAMSGAFTLGRMWPRGSKPKDSGSRPAVAPEFETFTREQLGRILDRLVRIEMTFNGHPTREQVHALNDATTAKIELLAARVAKLEFEVDGVDRRKAGG